MKKRENFMPLIPLKDLVILPGMIIDFSVGRPDSQEGIKYAMKGDRLVFGVCQKTEGVWDSKPEDLEKAGCVLLVNQIITLPAEELRIMVTAVRRGEIAEIEDREGVPFAEVLLSEDDNFENIKSGSEMKALIRNLRELLQQYWEYAGGRGRHALKQLLEIKDLHMLVEKAATQISMQTEVRQEYLNQVKDWDRYVFLCRYLISEVEILAEKRYIEEKLREAADANQKEFYLHEQLKIIKNELGEDEESEIDEYLKKIEALEADDEVKDKLKKEISHLRMNQGSPSEGAVIRSYIELLLELPWNYGKEDSRDLYRAEKILREEHYGLLKVKERIIQYLSVRYVSPELKAPVLCLYGPPGTGKTSIAKSIARALDKEYVRVCLGGVRDEAEIRGHRKTYVGAMPGRIIEGMKQAGVKNPLMLLDEIDKTGSDRRGDTASALLEVLDNEQNYRFRDHYVELPVDLSKVLFIATANDIDKIPRPLLDRMELIELSGYTGVEKFHIAKDYLIPKALKENGIKKKQLKITDSALTKIIRSYTREAGVRELERAINKIVAKGVHDSLEEIWERQGVEGDLEEFKKSVIRVNERNLEHFLGKVKYEPLMKNAKPEVGLVRGLAWTSVGGVTLEIEVNTMPGEGKMELTGKLGDVMKESAGIAFSYVRSVADEYGVKPKYFKEHDFHLHIPEGATPKDGPSAGITMVLAFLSAVTKRKVRADVAMTGEVNLRGKVLPIGGLKEKLLAAKEAGITTVFVPKQNERDVHEIGKEPELLEGMEIIYLTHVKELIEGTLI